MKEWFIKLYQGYGNLPVSCLIPKDAECVYDVVLDSIGNPDTYRHIEFVTKSPFGDVYMAVTCGRKKGTKYNPMASGLLGRRVYGDAALLVFGELPDGTYRSGGIPDEWERKVMEELSHLYYDKGCNKKEHV